MAKEIGIKLNITSQGEQRVIKNLNELEAELQSLQGQLKTLDFGSAEFKRTAAEIANLKSRIDDVDKATEGIGAEKRFRALGDAVNILTGSFQVLSGALGLVITDSEDLEAVQKAETQALQVLNVALGINSINTALVESATLRATIATKLNTIATNVATKAQAAWNFVLSLNPIGAVIAGVVGLTAAIYGLVKAYDALFGSEAQQAKQLKEINKLENDLIETRKNASKDLEAQIVILTDNITTRNLELKVLNDLKKAYPGLNAFVDKNNKLTEEGIEFLKLQIQLRQQEAALIAVQGKIVEKEIAFEEEAAKIRQEYGASAGILIEELREDYDEQLAPVIAVQTKYTKAIDATLGALRPYQKALDEQVKKEEKLKQGQKGSVEVLTARGKLLERISGLLKQQNTELSKLLEVELEYSADVLDFQNKLLQDQEDLLGRRADLLKDTGEELTKQIEELLFAVVPNEEDLLKAKDQYKGLFDAIGDLVKSGQLDFTQALTPELVANVLGGVSEEYKKVFQNLTADSEQVLLDFFNELKTRTGEIEKITAKQNLNEAERLKLVNNLSDAEDEIYELLKNRVELGLTQSEAEERALVILKQKLGLVDFEKKLNDQLTAAKNSNNKLDIAAAETALANYKEFEKTLEASIVRSVKFYEGIEVITNQSNQNLAKILKNTQEIKREFSPEELKKISKFFEENIGEVDNLVSSIFGNLQKYRERLGDDGLNSVLEGVSKGIKGLGEESEESLLDTQQYLETYIAIGNAIGEDTTEAQKLLGVVNKQLKDINLQEFFTDLNEGLTEATDQLFRLVDRYYDTLQQRSSLTLEQITRDEEAALAAIDEALKQSGANTKRLEEERSAITKKAAQERFEIEKKSRINELKFSLAQVISDSALAITNVLASVPVPLNFVLAGTTGALALGQVAAVRDQLTFVQSQQFIGRRGGLITGESHEGSNGGVPAMLEGGEFVVNRAAVSQYGDLIGELNSSTGGRRLSIDDSRLVQAIASQNSSTPPLKAYVLYNDIQSTEKLNNKITQLARL